MQNNFKQSKFYRNFKENRAVYITAITLLLALAVIVAVTAVANRSKNPPETGDSESGTETVAPTPGTDTEPPASTDVIDILPSFSLPVSGTLIKSHDATAQVFSNTMKDYRVHLGVDISTEQSAPVYAAAEGTVSQIWEDALMGQCIAVKHGGDAYTIYKNLSAEIPEDIKEGAEVEVGQLIGCVGETAMIEIAEEPHLHFEMTVGGLSVNPLDYFEEEVVATLAGDDNYEKSTAE